MSLLLLRRGELLPLLLIQCLLLESLGLVKQLSLGGLVIVVDDELMLAPDAVVVEGELAVVSKLGLNPLTAMAAAAAAAAAVELGDEAAANAANRPSKKGNSMNG